MIHIRTNFEWWEFDVVKHERGVAIGLAEEGVDVKRMEETETVGQGTIGRIRPRGYERNRIEHRRQNDQLLAGTFYLGQSVCNDASSSIGFLARVFSAFDAS